MIFDILVVLGYILMYVFIGAAVLGVCCFYKGTTPKKEFNTVSSGDITILMIIMFWPIVCVIMLFFAAGWVAVNLAETVCRCIYKAMGKEIDKSQ